ncbi:hypothetical protein HPT27_10390 [Permianibacter sp. IMCC34836]|uniref:hypothetical protein n=1 Tax=Permianibacter fluminis TaxID=2738515 RepID=UPI00155467D2|nr:hypothetical protein [Permianibacter fluminis]NQD37437.1 hypothetical protein [Permianibacter fluminis]
MKRYLHASLVIVLAGIISSIVIGCGSSNASGGSGPSQSDFNALKATVTALQQTVTGLQTEVAALGSSVSRVSTGGAGKNKLAEGDACTYVGWLPADKPIYQANSLQCRSATGYLFALPAPDGGFPLRSTVYYTSADCSGTPYVATQDLSAYGRLQGAVFSYGNNQAQTNVGYVVPNSTLISGTTNSNHRNGACQTETIEFVFEALAEVLPNDPVVTDVSNEAYPGPVVMQ